MRSTFRRPPARRCCRCRPGAAVGYGACSCGTNERPPVRPDPVPSRRGSHPGDRIRLRLGALALVGVALGVPATTRASQQACLAGAAGEVALDRHGAPPVSWRPDGGSWHLRGRAATSARCAGAKGSLRLIAEAAAGAPVIADSVTIKGSTVALGPSCPLRKGVVVGTNQGTSVRVRW